MKKEFTPIAMRCTQEQFEVIKPKLEGLEINSVTSFKEYPYLVNCDGELNTIVISNIDDEIFEHVWDKKPEIHETWDEQIFLEACGIEVEKTKDVFEITKEQIWDIDNFGYSKVRDMFPSVFEEEKKEVVFKNWYVGYHYANRFLCFIDKEIETHVIGYGFDKYGWQKEFSFIKTFYYGFELATESEVFEALKNEAVKRGFKEGVYCVSALINEVFQLNESDFDFDENGLRLGGVLIFNYKTGQWAEIIETISLNDAEKQLGKKII